MSPSAAFACPRSIQYYIDMFLRLLSALFLFFFFYARLFFSDQWIRRRKRRRMSFFVLFFLGIFRYNISYVNIWIMLRSLSFLSSLLHQNDRWWCVTIVYGISPFFSRFSYFCCSVVADSVRHLIDRLLAAFLCCLFLLKVTSSEVALYSRVAVLLLLLLRRLCRLFA